MHINLFFPAYSGSSGCKESGAGHLKPHGGSPLNVAQVSCFKGSLRIKACEQVSHQEGVRQKSGLFHY